MFTSVNELANGIYVYKNAFKNPQLIIDKLENTLGNSDIYKWQEAKVGYKKKNTDYRDCFDFKINKIENKSIIKNTDRLALEDIWQESYHAQLPAVEHYSSLYNIQLNYWESFNFIKYSENQHFKEHSDHGYSYVCVLSSVGYLNDNYEGGELFFPKFNLTVKPEAGDLYLFPSNFIYSHQALPVKSGTKYSIVTMLDYNENNHKES